MPQIGWFEILIIVVLAILIIGPKDFPIIIKKTGQWIGSIRRYFSDIQKDIGDMENSLDDEISLEENKIEDKKNERRKS